VVIALKRYLFNTLNQEHARVKVVISSILAGFLLFFIFSFFDTPYTSGIPQPEVPSPNPPVVSSTEPDPVDTCDTLVPERITYQLTVNVNKGNTLFSILNEGGVESCDARAAVSALKKVYNPRDLKIDQEVTLLFTHPADNPDHSEFSGISIPVGHDKNVVTSRNESDEFSVEFVARDLKTEVASASGTIEYSLYDAAIKAGLPVPVLMQLIHPFSFDVDFQRDIRPGDEFKVLFEQQLDEDGTVIREGPVLYASLTLRDTALCIYRHTTIDGETDYYNEKGGTVRKTLIKTPVDGARITSGYGMRRHPIAGYSKMHRGLDFGAPRGTPVMAAGSGTVVRAGRLGSYGNYIRIRHANGYATAYAHLKCFKRGIRSGKRVSQGDIIGYVGATGLATGPHLHYEVHYQGQKINPARVKFPPGRVLTGRELERFAKTRIDLEHRFAELNKVRTIAVLN